VRSCEVAFVNDRYQISQPGVKKKLLQPWHRKTEKATLGYNQYGYVIVGISLPLSKAKMELQWMEGRGKRSFS